MYTRMCSHRPGVSMSRVCWTTHSCAKHVTYLGRAVMSPLEHKCPQQINRVCVGFAKITGCHITQNKSKMFQINMCRSKYRIL